VPITPRLSQKLQQALGGEAGAEFMNWMHHVDARVGDVATRGDLAGLRADFAELRADFTELRQTTRADIAELRQEMQVGFAKVHEEMARLETRLERRFSDLIKWSFVFWVGAVGAIAILAGVLR
jgi:predicted  nucleic acid-binding Zn-ribbon protein